MSPKFSCLLGADVSCEFGIAARQWLNKYLLACALRNDWLTIQKEREREREREKSIRSTSMLYTLEQEYIV